MKEYRYHEVALMALELGQADIAVAEKKLAQEWIKKNGGRSSSRRAPRPAWAWP